MAFIPATSNWLGDWSGLDQLSWPNHIFLHFLLVFLLPATLLGTMSPVVAKMALDVGLGAGRTVGTIHAWSSIGSIAGTFVAGFYLVAWAGTETAILLTHLDSKDPSAATARLPRSRAPPQSSLFG